LSILSVILVSIVTRQTTTPLPSVERVLSTLGENLRLARLRRGLSATLVAERAGMSRPTLRAIERGEPSASLGAIANVLHCLGMEKDLAAVGRDDVLGRKLADLALDRRRPAPRKKR
jgi:transcriptional regulator with XRE-family HTH domain